MPGWHAKTEKLEAAGKLKVLGITQEQHPDRTRLFMQWHQMKWPVLLDSLNLLGCKGIPFTLLLDEHGVVRFQNPNEEDVAAFLETPYEAPSEPENSPRWPQVKESPTGLVLWGGTERIDDAIAALKHRIQIAPDDGRHHFRLGVAYRQRYDSAQRKETDFAKAIAAWSAALERDPSQYIWRRRIQQYGPRLDKPYSFYDWVHEAREAILARGETPHSLTAEPSGAEFAHPERQAPPTVLPEHPDPTGKVPEDRHPMVQIEATAVPSTQKGSPAFRVHLQFMPDSSRKVHWTNDAGPLSFFAQRDDAYAIHHFQPAELPQETVTSSETRHIEFELRPIEGAELPATLEGAAYYYVCEDVTGQCLFLRQPVSIPLR